MTSPTGAPFDVAVVGLGIVGVHHLTREAEGVLSQCTEVFLVDPGFGVSEHIASLGTTVTALENLYVSGQDRMKTYHEMATRVIAAALEKSPVGFATYGHPKVYCYPTTLIQRAAALLELRLALVAGVSAFDALCIDLDLDPAIQGLQMYEASDLVMRERPLQPDVPLFLWQVGVVGEERYFERNRGRHRFAYLQDYLERFYPGEHPVTQALSRTYPLAPSLMESFPLSDLAMHLLAGPQGGTLFVPPVSERPVLYSVAEALTMDSEPHGSTSPSSPRRAGKPVIGPQPPR